MKTVLTVARIGVGFSLVELELSISNKGLPYFEVVGDLSKNTRGCKTRVKSALINSGFEFPRHKIYVNTRNVAGQLEGTYLDLGLAALFLQLKHPIASDRVYIGELGLNGSVLKVDHIFNIVYFLKSIGVNKIVLPSSNFEGSSYDYSIFSGMEVSLVGKVSDLLSPKPVDTPQSRINNHPSRESVYFTQIKGNKLAKRALEIAAAGRHSVLFVGSPGVGKTMLGRALLELVPDLDVIKSHDVSYLHSLATNYDPVTQGCLKVPPYRSPHHTISVSSLLGTKNQLGEISLAHNGVLFMDELGLVSKEVLESFRTVLEDKSINLTYKGRVLVRQADFIFVAAMNSCPCGYRGEYWHGCKCSPKRVRDYLQRFSGAFLDRFDLIVKITESDTVGFVSDFDLARLRVSRARSVSGATEIPKKVLAELNNLCEKYHHNLRTQDSVIKVATTIARLEASVVVENKHVLEALTFKMKL